MSPREKKLAAAVGLVLIIWCATQGATKFRLALAEHKTIQQDAEQKLSVARHDKARGELAEKEKRTWAKQSLPTNPDIAQSAYRDWLRKQLSQAGLEIKQLGSKHATFGQSKFYKQFTFTIEAQGQIADVTKFLHSFYSSGHLHRVSKATLTPTSGRKKVVLDMTVDALSLVDCERTDTLSTRVSDQELPPLEGLLERIVSRNLFLPYQPPGAVTTATGEVVVNDTEAAQSFVTSMTKGIAGWRMSIVNRKSGKVLFFTEGDEIEVGQFKGTIDQLDGRRVIVSTAAERVQVELGDNLSQAQPLDSSAG